MSDDELKQIEDAFNSSTQGQWHFMLVREGKEEILYHLKDHKDPKSEIVSRIVKIDPRWDVFCGDPLSESDKKEPATIGLKGRKQILHFHPESPTVFEKCSNLKDGEFVVMAHKMVPKMIEEIKKLKGDKNGQ